jgi:probable F420-dependent oxidoreductase
VEFGFSLPGRGPLASPDVVLGMAERAEALGYASLFVTDHVVLPVSTAGSVYPYSATGQFPGGSRQDYLEPLVMLSHLARATRRIRLGTSVLVVPYRNPLLTAKMLATIDVLSGGRVVLGAGVGWLREEFEALGAPPFAERGRVTDEYLALMRAAWTTDPVTFEGRHYRVRDVHLLPKPVQPGGIPIWVGGHTDGAIRRAARLGDGWHPIALRPPGLLEPDDYAVRVKQLRAFAEAAGRDPGALTLTLRVPMAVRPRRAKAPAGDRPLFQGTAAEVIADIHRYQALGVTHLVFDPTVQDLRSALENMARFADEVRGKIEAGRSQAASVVAGSARPASTVGGLRKARPGSARRKGGAA